MKSFGSRTLPQKFVGVNPSFGGHGRAKRDQGRDPAVGAGGAQSDRRAKRKADKNDGLAEFMAQPIQRHVHVVDLAAPVVVPSLAAANAAKIEP